MIFNIYSYLNLGKSLFIYWYYEANSLKNMSTVNLWESHILCVCLFYILYYSPLEGVGCGLKAQRVKLTRLILQIGSPYYHLTLKEISLILEACSTCTLSVSLAWNSWKKQKWFIYNYFNQLQSILKLEISTPSS